LVTTGVSAWNSTQGEPLEERLITTGGDSAVNYVINKYPASALANAATGHALEDDGDAIVGMGSGFIEGFQHGGISGGIHGANQQLDKWADDMSSQNGLVGDIARTENTVIGDAYPVVSNAIGTATHDVSSAASSVGHAASSAWHSVTSLL
jgi:hypothetical protein